MDKGLGTSSVDLLVSAWAEASPLIGLVLIAAGVAYLFFGKWLFRVFVAGLGIAIGLELGRFVAASQDIGAEWFPWVVAAAVGLIAWPLWQLVIFVGAGGAMALALGEMVHGIDGQERFYLAAVLFGFLAGGLLAVVVMRAIAVGLSALAGATLVMAGLLAVGYGKLPFVDGIAEPGWPRMAFFLLLVGLGVLVQLFLPAPEDMSERREEKEKGRAKADDDAEARRRYERALARGQ